MPGGLCSSADRKPSVDANKPWHVVNKDLSFLPATGDFTIVCKDSAWNGKLNPNGALTVFQVDKKEWLNVSPTLNEKAPGSPAETTWLSDRHFHTDDDSKIVCLVLCALFKPDHPKLKHCQHWEDISEALISAAYWDMPQARQNLFYSLMSLAADPKLKPIRVPIDVGPFFAEAVGRGGVALSAAMGLFRARYKSQSKPRFIPIRPVYLMCCHIRALGPSGCSKIVEAVLVLASEGVLKRVNT